MMNVVRVLGTTCLWRSLQEWNHMNYSWKFSPRLVLPVVVEKLGEDEDVDQSQEDTDELQEHLLHLLARRTGTQETRVDAGNLVDIKKFNLSSKSLCKSL